jgi:MoxR-like ATPase
MPLSEATLTKGSGLHVTWQVNAKSGGRFPVKSNVTDEGRVKKIILPDLKGLAAHPVAGENWRCEVVRVTGKPDKKFGIIWVRPIERVLEVKVPKGVWVEQLQLELMLVALLDPERNVMMVGPQGSGKTTVSLALATVLGARYFKVPGEQIKKADRMLGEVNAGTEGKRLKFIWADSPLTTALREAERNPHLRFLVHIDEWTRIDEDARDATLGILTGVERKLFLHNGDVVNVSKNVHFVASGNVGSEFTIKRRDAANNDRWEIFVVDYMPHEEELKHVISKYPGCPKDQMDIALKVINSMRTAVRKKELNLPYKPSVRRSEAIAMYLASPLFERGGVDLPCIMQNAVTNQYDGTADDTSSDFNRVSEFIKMKLKELTTSAKGEAAKAD